MITTYDLENNKYSIKELEENITHLCFYTILKTQHITYEFCRDYIMNESLQDKDEDNIDTKTILFYQPHLKKYY